MAVPTLPTRESFTPLSKPRKVDAEKGIAEGLCVVGRESRNGSEYPTAVLEKYKALYEGAPCYVDLGGVHQRNVATQDPPATSKLGIWHNVRVESGGLYADLRFNPRNAFAPELVWALDNFPEQYGCSHVARVGWRPKADGGRVAESIAQVFSVDIVSEPATTTTLRESKNMDTPADPRMVATTLTTPDALAQFLTALMDALPSGAFSDTEKSQVLSQLMTKYQAADAGDVTAEPAMESLSRLGQLGKKAAAFIREKVTESKRAERIQKARTLCQTKSLPAHLTTDTFVETVAESLDTAGRAEALIADRIATGRPAGGVQPPARTEPNTGTGGGQPKKTIAQLRDEAVAGYSG